MPPRKDLGALLLDEDVLNAKDLERMRDQRPLWSALIDAQLASADQIFGVLSTRFGVPAVSEERLAEVMLPEPFLRTLSRGEALKAGLLPIDLALDGQRATVVMVDPSDEATLAAFLTRAGVPEGRALLGRREPLLRAIERCFKDATAVVAPLKPPRRWPTGQNNPKLPREEVTGTVKLDPELQAELARLPARLLQAEPLTPQPRAKPRTPTLQMTSPTPPATLTSTSAPATAPPVQTHAPQPFTPLQPQPQPATASAQPQPVLSYAQQAHAAPHSYAPAVAPPPTAQSALSPMYAAAPPAASAESPESDKEALRAEERLSRALVQTVEALASELEARLVGGAGQGAEMARLCRQVARQLNLPRRTADEIGVTAQLFVLDRLMRNIEGAPSAELFSELGWAAAGEEGLLPMLRALTASASGFGRADGGTPPVGARIVTAVADYVELVGSAAAPDLDTVAQLLRASPAGPTVVDALLHVLELDRGDLTPETPTVTASSVLREDATPTSPAMVHTAHQTDDNNVLRDDADEDPTPPVREVGGDKPLRKPMSRKREGE